MIVACQFCTKPAELVTGAEIYPHLPHLENLFFWRCQPCDAYVGCHPQHPRYNPTGQNPKGTLANAPLRAARKLAHQEFDKLWKDGLMSRHEAYAWLQQQTGLSKDECHMGLMNVEQCVKVVEVVRKNRVALEYTDGS